MWDQWTGPPSPSLLLWFLRKRDGTYEEKSVLLPLPDSEGGGQSKVIPSGTYNLSEDLEKFSTRSSCLIDVNPWSVS